MKRLFKITPLMILLFLAGSHQAFSFAPVKSTTGVSTVTKGGSNVINNSRRVGSALKLDKYHNFNRIIDNYAGQASRFSLPTKGPGGLVTRQSELFQIEGSLNGKSGVFEWILDTGQVTHRRFIPGGRVTGLPNQIP